MTEYIISALSFITGILCGMALSAGIVVGYIERHRDLWYKAGQKKEKSNE